ncbi:homoserine kinase [Aeromicrobium chenweiae]|uniref:Homoserine kinase n=1 Tax=Aeromicrobium chenweiae TaxID=2079793 RepID=A0A2S0WNS3_9ACTN|nr:homoserine kinase [Aeromicrobium chenweiae]AWB92961.1 homoserine kinase [Aeromicrobium chenweiae]TGN33954.1 homoserine kinase [Aeromicrobium chenweiae]
MTFVDGPVTVRVPASSANLGPGFDALGLALTLHDTLTAQVVDEGLDVHVTGEGKDGVPLDETHLVVEAMHAAFDLLGGRPSGLRLTCTNQIPHGRGLGSSAAAIVGGIVLARALVEGGELLLDDAAAYQLAVDLEGHPDNVAAALFGGLTIAWIDGAAAEVERLETGVEVTVFVPPAAVSTAKARGLLPESVPHADAARNAGRAALLISALTGAPHRLISATEDWIHQGYRSEAMPESYKLLRKLRVEGIPAIISGAGPTVLVFARGVADRAPAGWTVHELQVDAGGAEIVRDDA